MGKLNDLAKKASGVSAITEGKTKLSTEEVIAKFPEGVTISAVDVFRDSEKDSLYAVCDIAEDETVYFFGGQAITTMVLDFITECGTVEAVNEQLKNEPIKIKLTKGKTKKGRDFTSFEVI